jgi:putative acetyltransferase
MTRTDPCAGIEFRPIQPGDDAVVASLIREVMTEFGCIGCGYASEDPEVDAMSEAYPGGDRLFLVVCRAGTIDGGGGFGPLTGSSAAEAICELRKMYFTPPLRGLGVGAKLLDRLLAGMRAAGFRRCYLETTSRMTAAQSLYRKAGFVELPHRLGETGHSGCDRFYSMDL